MTLNKKLFLLDIDGTLALGEQLLPGAKSFLEKIEAIEGRYYFLTNNTTNSTQDYVEKFRKWGIETKPWQFITAGYVTIEYLQRYYAGQRIYAVATSAFKEEMQQAGIEITEDTNKVTCVLVAYDDEVNYKKLRKACELLQDPTVAYIASNKDKRCPGSKGFIPDCGALCDLIQSVVGRQPIYLGKPYTRMVEVCLDHSSSRKEEALLIGDRLYTDIACGLNAGIDTCLVLTGETSLGDVARSTYIPNYCFADLLTLSDAIQKKKK